MSVNDPCISVCRFDGRTGWCFGCGRTIPEIRSWKKMQPHARKVVQNELPRRVKRIAGKAAKHRDKRPKSGKGD